MALKVPDPGSTSVRFGPAFLRPAKERDQYELMRPIITATNEGDRTVTEAHPSPVMLAIYRLKRKGDVLLDVPFGGPPAEMRSMDTKGQPLQLVLHWWPGLERGDDGAV